MQVIAEEQKIIEQHRLKKAITEAQLSAGHAIVTVAYQWVEYSKNTGYRLTYSEFCEGFRFDDRVENKYHPYRNFIYEGVKRMSLVVDDISIEIGNAIVTKNITGA